MREHLCTQAVLRTRPVGNHGFAPVRSFNSDQLVTARSSSGSNHPFVRTPSTLTLIHILRNRLGCRRSYVSSAARSRSVSGSQSATVLAPGRQWYIFKIVSTARHQGRLAPLKAFLDARAFPSAVRGPVDRVHGRNVRFRRTMRALPAGVRGPVERFQGFQVLINSACRARRSLVQVMSTSLCSSSFGERATLRRFAGLRPASPRSANMSIFVVAPSSPLP
jgi:hypothetical protein